MPYTPFHLDAWQPGSGASSLDSAANYVGTDLSAFYLAPIHQTRDTADAISRSNWRRISADLDAVSQHEDTGIVRIGHWACGWYEMYLIHRSDEACLMLADDIAAKLSDYCVYDEDDWSDLEREDEERAYIYYVSSDFTALLIDALEAYAPADAPPYWADDIITELHDDKLSALFWDWCAAGTIEWEHSDYLPDCRLPKPADIPMADLIELTGLPLLHPDQEWRREPYPWPGAEPEPLEPPLGPLAP